MRTFLLALLLCASGASAQTTHTVVVRSFTFTPAALTIEAGDTVQWVNEDGAHNVSQLSGPEAFGRPDVGAGWTYEFTFSQIGTSTYQCDPHSGVMQGSITVTSNTSTEEAPDASASLTLASENPFTGSVRLVLTLVQSETVRVAVFDARGREVDVIYEGVAAAGQTDFVWAAGASRPGVYIIRATAPGLALSQGVSLAGKAEAHTGGH